MLAGAAQETMLLAWCKLENVQYGSTKVHNQECRVIESLPSSQFRTQDLFLTIFATAAVLACVAQETLMVAVATVFCCFSWIGLAMAIWISGSYFVRQLTQAFRSHQFRYFLGRRIKWTILDVMVLAWLLVAVAVANYVLENYVSGAKIMLFVGLGLSPVIAALLMRRVSFLMPH